jgi:NAD(P)-dependent dehydrogenase (short-subunit alcohol dehydrogenase family)
MGCAKPTASERPVVTADLSRTDSVEQLARQALEAFGGLEILVNNAGIPFPEPCPRGCRECRGATAWPEGAPDFDRASAAPES